MTRDVEESVVFVVMEHASEWPSHIKGGAAGCVAIRQQPNEDHVDLLLRAHERVRAIERIGGCVERAVLSCNDDPSGDTDAALNADAAFGGDASADAALAGHWVVASRRPRERSRDSRRRM
jgi:hypothetical protein